MILIQSAPIGDNERSELLRLLETSTFDERQRHLLYMAISVCTWEQYDKAKQNLLNNQTGIDGANNPSQSEINKHIRKISKVPE